MNINVVLADREAVIKTATMYKNKNDYLAEVARVHNRKIQRRKITQAMVRIQQRIKENGLHH